MQEQMKKAVGDNFQMNMSEGANSQGDWSQDEGEYYAKGCYGDSVEYNNEVLCITNITLENMEEMNDAMDDKDYNRAEQIRLEWIKNIPNYIAQVNELGAYKNDPMLQKAANWMYFLTHRLSLLVLRYHDGDVAGAFHDWRSRAFRTWAEPFHCRSFVHVCFANNQVFNI